MNSTITAKGKLSGKLINCPRPPLKWRLQNALRWSYIWGLICNALAVGFSRLTGVPTITAQLSAVFIGADGRRINFGVLSRRLITTAGVGFLVDDWTDSTTDITNMKYHACGTGTNAENVSDSALQTEATTITDRATGTMTQPSANVQRSVGTQSFTNTGAITEHGLFSVVTESSGVLWDRSVFSAINVINGDSIQWTYECTVNSGG